MCTVLHDKIQWKKENKTTKQIMTKRNEKYGSIPKTKQKQTNKTNKGREVFSFKTDVEGFRYLVKVGGHRSGNV